MARKKPDSFKALTTPRGTYSATGTADATSTGTTLIATTNMFSNNMVGFDVYNFTDGTTATITAFTSATTVTVDTTIGDTWDGDTIYVLGNEFTLTGTAADAFEINYVWIKFNSGDQNYLRLEHFGKTRNYENGYGFNFSSLSSFYTTTLTVNGIPTPAVGIYPMFNSYAGKFYLEYLKKPPVLVNTTDSPSLATQGIGQVIINGVLAWGFGILGNDRKAQEYNELYKPRGEALVMPKGTTALMTYFGQSTASGHITPRQPNRF
jgi:hypothetical protein